MRRFETFSFQLIHVGLLTSEPLSQIILPALRAEKNQSAPRESESICRFRSMEILTPNIRSQRELHEYTGKDSLAEKKVFSGSDLIRTGH